MTSNEVKTRSVRASALTLESECTQAERGLLCRVLTGHELTDRHLEIGTAAGGTLKELINTYANPDKRPAFFVIDPLTYYENQFEKITRNLQSANIDPESVTFWKGTTEDFLERERAAGTTFDFIFIDGDHRHYPVMVDLQWADLVRPNGFIALHDHCDKFPGVIWSTDYFLKKNPNYRLVEKVDSLVVLQKTGPNDGKAVTPADLRASHIAQLKFKYKRSLKTRLKFLFG